MQYYVIKEVKNANYLGVLLIIIYHIMSILTTLLERLIMLNVFSSGTSVNAPLISKAIAIRA